MTYYDVYIGRLDDPRFSWGGEGREGSPPTRSSPFFPPARGRSGGYPGGAFGDLVDAIERGRFRGRQVDWGSWVAAVTKNDIETFMEEIYGEEEEDDSLRELRAYVAGLQARKRYALVASEL